MAPIGILIAAFAVFTGIGMHQSDLKKEARLKQENIELKAKYEAKLKSKPVPKVVRNQNIEIVNMGTA
jgi:hypothetical protein